MVSRLENPWNNAVTFLRLKFRDHELASGSGFFWGAGERTYLVSNWHNFAGRSTADGSPLAAHGGVPDRVSFSCFQQLSPPDEAGNIVMRGCTVEAALYASDDLSAPLWMEHPTFGRKIDVAAVDVSTSLAAAGTMCLPAQSLEGDADVPPRPSQDAFILGYPLGLITTAPIPVWKRATIATEPSFDIDGLPKVYVDTASRKGMSGSLVLVRHILAGQYLKKDGTKSNTIYAQRDQILGIYSGRLGAHQVEAQLGIVWKRSVIDETVTAQVLAKI